MEGHKCSNICHHLGASNYAQSLTEMDFERGLWAAATNGEVDRLRQLLSNGHDPNASDSSGYVPLVCFK